MSETQCSEVSPPGSFLTVLKSGKSGPKPMLLCQCVCGNKKWYRTHCVLNGKRNSCGCKNPPKRNYYHGHAKTGNKHPYYGAWGSMISRCQNKNHQQYARYGARGITVCDRWKGDNGFLNFLADMGDRPVGYSIDRIDNDKGYSPENCRWASGVEQQRNTRKNVLIECDGKTQCIAAWAEEFNIPWHRIYTRLRRGWEPERAIKTVAQPRKNLVAWSSNCNKKKTTN